MRRLPELQGVVVPMLTPIMDNNSIDLDGAARLSEKFLASEYVDGLFTIGASGEFMDLSYADRIALMETFAKVQRGNKIITVNTGGMPYKQTLELTRLAGEMNFTAVAVSVPDEVEPDTASVLEYFKGISDIGVPFMIYWTPMVKKHKPTFEVITKLLEFENFVGLKDSSRDMVEFSAIAGAYGQEISIFQGVEMLHLASLSVGSAGVVGGGLNIYPGSLAAITRNFEAGNMAEAREQQLMVIKAWDVLAEGAAFRSLCKQYWSKNGIITGTRCRTGNNIELTESKLTELNALVCV